MKLTALTCLVLCCCATVRPAIPSSLPLLQVDESLNGARISPEGMRVVLKKREQERAAHEKRVADLLRDNRGLAMERDASDKRAAQNAFWSDWGPTIAGGSFLGGAGITAALIFLILYGGQHGK